jgi:hypothetical protein
VNPWAYKTGVAKRDIPLLSLAQAFGAKDSGPDTTYKGGLSLFWGFGDPVEEKIVKCMREARPFLHMDHAYFKRGYEHGNFRINFGHFHQTKLLPVSRVRTGLATKRLQDWKKGGRQIVVVVPSDRICMVLGSLHNKIIKPKDWARETEARLEKYTDRPLIRKEKGGSILDALKGAHACVSLSSVAEVESAVYGVPVFTSYDSPASQVSEKDLAKIEAPIYPDREQWLRTLSYSQFHISELKDGTAVSILKDLYGLDDIR